MIFLSKSARFSVFSWAIDMIIIFLFILIGLKQHEIAASFWYPALIALPFIVSWSVVGFVTNSFRIGREIAKKSFLTKTILAWLGALFIAIVVRMLALDKDFQFTFTLIAFLFNGILFIVWRIIYVNWCVPNETSEQNAKAQ